MRTNRRKALRSTFASRAFGARHSSVFHSLAAISAVTLMATPAAATPPSVEPVKDLAHGMLSGAMGAVAESYVAARHPGLPSIASAVALAMIPGVMKEAVDLHLRPSSSAASRRDLRTDFAGAVAGAALSHYGRTRFGWTPIVWREGKTAFVGVASPL